MATESTTRFTSMSQPAHLADVRAWAILKASCGHQRAYFGNGRINLPTGPVRLPAAVMEGQGVRHV